MPATVADTTTKGLCSIVAMPMWPKGEGRLAVNRVFLDTDMIVYANDARDAQKQARAMGLVTATMREGTGVISSQVMQEYAVVASGKLRQDPDTVLRQLLLLESFEVIQLRQR